QLEQQQTENERLSNLLAQANASQLSASNQLNELLKLRGEVGALREQKMEWDRTGAAVKANRQAEGVGASAIPARIPRESWAFAGYSSPEAALESVVWAMSKGDLKTLLASATAEAQRLLAQQYAAKSAGEIAASLTEEASGLPELALDSKVVLADGTVSFTIAVFDAEKGDTRIHDEAVMHFENVGGEWKYSLRSGVRGAGTNSDQGGGHN
ncbi:MAG: hypothetical protein NT154_27865, partial [Verrucomicrobia bacterium]|nr:hypothetical protein [Verrucomicrobiota bacterium]